MRKQRNPVGLEPQRFLMLSTVYKNLSRSSKTSKRAVERTCKSSRADKGKGKAHLEVSPRPVGAKRRRQSASVLLKSGEQESDFSTETDYDSDEFTLATINRNKKAVSKRTFKSSRASKGKGKTHPAAAPRNVRAKRTKPISEVHRGECSSATCEGSPSSDIMMAVNTLLSLSQDKQSEYGTSICKINRNPAELEIEEANEYMRGA